jgi:hypothetical protein
MQLIARNGFSAIEKGIKKCESVMAGVKTDEFTMMNIGRQLKVWKHIVELVEEMKIKEL